MGRIGGWGSGGHLARLL